MAQLSYFAEETRRNSNPNFINNMKPEDIIHQVKRIIKDVQKNIITDNDYIYFSNPRLISVCISECYKNWRECETLKDALNHRLTSVLVTGVGLPPHLNLDEERVNTANLLKKYTNATSVWYIAYTAFKDVDSFNRTGTVNGAIIPPSMDGNYQAPPHKIILSNKLCNLDRSLFYDM